MEYNHEVILCIVNAGFADAVMESAKKAGATGGTIVHARGTANPEAEKFFNVAISSDKEMVMILVDKNIKKDVLNALYDDVGLNTEGKGIAFSLPVTGVVGIK